MYASSASSFRGCVGKPVFTSCLIKDSMSLCNNANTCAILSHQLGLDLRQQDRMGQPQPRDTSNDIRNSSATSSLSFFFSRLKSRLASPIVDELLAMCR